MYNQINNVYNGKLINITLMGCPSEVQCKVQHLNTSKNAYYMVKVLGIINLDYNKSTGRWISDPIIYTYMTLVVTHRHL